MSAPVELIDPVKINPNPDNPRLIFRSDELESLENSIAQQGILVPLTVFRDGKTYTLLDGERRWRCARKLSLHRVPVIIQDKPDKLTNIMMMFAIHNARNDWDPLPTALKLEELEIVLSGQYGRTPTESELAGAASLTRGEVRRYRKILALPKKLKEELLDELKKPRAEQSLTVDHVIETISGVRQLYRREIVAEARQDRLIRATVDKFRNEVLTSTTEPRLFARIARSYERGEVPKKYIVSELRKYLERKKYTIQEVFENTSAIFDYEHATENLIIRLDERLNEILENEEIKSESLHEAISQIEGTIRQIKKLL